MSVSSLPPKGGYRCLRGVASAGFVSADLGLARALRDRPPVILLNEPTASLAGGMTAMVVTHNPAQAQRLDRLHAR